jgi:neutral amino acid transport system permease protein
MDWASIISNALYAAISANAIGYALAAIGVNVHFGFTGLLNFGQAAFLAAGAYGVAIGVTEFGWSLWLSVFLGLGVAVILALLLGVPTLRLRADYLAIVTIAAAEIIRLLVRSARFDWFTGGSDGKQGFAGDFESLNPFDGNARYSLWEAKFSGYDLWVLIVGWGLVVLASLFVFLLMRSPWGRVLKSIREDEDAARSLGKSVFSYKMQSLVIGGVIGALGVVMLALAARSVQPDNYGTPLTFFAYTALILGGTATIKGPVIGSMLFWVLLSLTEGLLRGALEEGYIPDWLMDANQVGQVRFMLVGLGLILLMVFRPQGIFGDRRELDLDGRT